MSLWQQCLEHLENQLDAQQYNTWILPLQAVEEGNNLKLLAPNRFVKDFVNERFVSTINEIVGKIDGAEQINVVLEIGTRSVAPKKAPAAERAVPKAAVQAGAIENTYNSTHTPNQNFLQIM